MQTYHRQRKSQDLRYVLYFIGGGIFAAERKSQICFHFAARNIDREICFDNE